MSAILPEGESKRLLIVDDQPDLLQILLLQLRRHGYDATLCTSVKAAEEALSGGRYAGALIDLYFGAHPAGLDLIAKIRSQPATANMPVISMSGSGDKGLLRCLKAGADATLAKPFMIPEFLTALVRATALRGWSDGTLKDLNPG